MPDRVTENGVMEKRGWFVGCGSCNGNAWVRNAGIVRDATCDQCKDYGTDPDSGVYVLDALVSTELGWCACGNPEKVDRMMLTYLEWAEARFDDQSNVTWDTALDNVSDDAKFLLAYIADDLDWTEHGGSVGGAWLTDDGKQAMANLRATKDVI